MHRIDGLCVGNEHELRHRNQTGIIWTYGSIALDEMCTDYLFILYGLSIIFITPAKLSYKVHKNVTEKRDGNRFERCCALLSVARNEMLRNSLRDG